MDILTPYADPSELRSVYAGYFVHFARGNEILMNNGTNQIKVNLIHRIRKEKRKPDMLSRDLQQLCAQTLARLYRDSRKPRVFFMA